MKNISIVVGAGYDDTNDIKNITNYLCKTHQNKETILVVLYNGSYFYSTHFGAGTENGNVTTYITKDFVVYPESFCGKYEKFLQNNIHPNIIINKNARLCFYSDIILNTILWNERDDDYDGGLYEVYNRHDYQVTIGDFITYTVDKKVNTIKRVFEYHEKRLKNLGLYNDSVLKEIMSDSINLMKIINKYIVDFYTMCSYCNFVDNDYEVFNQFDNIIFQSTLGLLKSESSCCFYPNIVCYNTGIKYAVNILEHCIFNEDNTKQCSDINDVQIYYVSKPYLENKYKGRFDTEDTDNIKNKYNIQCSRKLGYFDYINIVLEIQHDISYIDMTNIPYLKNFIFTNTDLTSNKILLPDNIDTNIKTHDGEKMDCIYKFDGENLIEINQKSLYQLKELDC